MKHRHDILKRLFDLMNEHNDDLGLIIVCLFNCDQSYVGTKFFFS